MKFIAKTTIFLTILSFSFGIFSQQARATAGETPFGGFSVVVINCDVSQNYWIIHTAVAGPANIIFQEGISKLYPYSKVKESGNWLLGNVSTPVPCVKMIGPHPVTLGTFPLITIVGTSDPSKTAQSGRSGTTGDNSNNNGTSGGSDTSPGYREPGNTGGGDPTRPTGPGGQTPAEQGKTEQEVRDDLKAHGVEVAPDLSPTLSPVSKLPNNAIAGVEDLKQDCGPNCDVMITSGARQPGNPVAPGEHGTGKPVLDLNKDPGQGGLDEYVVDNSSSNYTDRAGTHYIMPNGDEYLDENYGNTGGTGSHWHVRYNANHMGQTA